MSQGQQARVTVGMCRRWLGMYVVGSRRRQRPARAIPNGTVPWPAPRRGPARASSRPRWTSSASAANCSWTILLLRQYRPPPLPMPSNRPPANPSGPRRRMPPAVPAAWHRCPVPTYTVNLGCARSRQT